MLDPSGEGARSIARLTWWMTALLTVVAVVTVALMLYALFRRRPPEDARREDENRKAILWVLIGGIAVPGVVLVVLFLFIMGSLGTLAERADGDVTIEVTGHRWWWEVTYRFDEPGLSFTTANEVHIPVGPRIRVVLSSYDVIHSFWVPDVQGKTDVIPGRRNETWLQADEPGVFRGQCAEFCGLQHTNMALVVVAQPPDSFALWLERQRQPAPPPTNAVERTGQRLFMDAACALCHTIRGSAARGQVAPDLTHLASRRTLASGMLPNTRGHLGGWITNPQSIKPGSLMPDVPLPADQVTALLTYLETLR